MSTPRSTALPVGTRPVRLSTGRGRLAGLIAHADNPAGTLLCAPGFTGSKEDFLHLLPETARLGWTTIALDHLGQYQSQTADGADAFGLDLWAQDLVDVAGQIPGPVHLLGHSLGGLIAGRAAQSYPWATVTLLNSGSGPIHESRQQTLRALLAALGHVSMEDIWQFKVTADKAGGWQAPSPEVEEFLRARFISNDPHAMVAMAHLLLDGYTQDFRDVNPPVLIAFGVHDHDAWPLSVQEQMARDLRLPLALIPDAAHSPAVEQPEATAALIAGHMAWVTPARVTGVQARGYGYLPGMHVVTPLDPESAAVPRARRILTDHLWAWGLVDMTDDVELITAELVSNAIRHGGRSVELRITCHAESLRIAVWDNSPNQPVTQAAPPTQMGGRGLILIGRVARDWGCSPSPGGKEVWAEIPLQRASAQGA